VTLLKELKKQTKLLERLVDEQAADELLLKHDRKGVPLIYGNGRDCPVLGGAPDKINCCGCHRFKDCAHEGTIPICYGCSRRHICNFAPTSGCTIYLEEKR
jgi:hypothetical protein